MAPTPVGSSQGSGSCTIDAGTQGQDLILFFAYCIPASEGTGGATYGTITGPSGFTAGSGSPLANNDANITTNSGQRIYYYYKYAAGTVGVASADASTTPTFSSTATLAALITLMLVVRGGPTASDPFTQDSGPSTGVTISNTTAFPAVSLTLGQVNNLLVWVGGDHSFNTYNPTGWTSQQQDAYFSMSTLVQAGSGSTGSIAPSSGSPVLSSFLMNIAPPVIATSATPGPRNFTRAATQRASTW